MHLMPPPMPALLAPACPAAHPHTKLATLVYCESLCGDVGVVQEMVNGDAGVALVGAWDRLLGGLLAGSMQLCSLSRPLTSTAGSSRLVAHHMPDSPPSAACVCLPACLQVHLLDLSGRDPQLRLRAANLLGLLIRHASSISPALVNAGKPLTVDRSAPLHPHACSYQTWSGIAQLA